MKQLNPNGADVRLMLEQGFGIDSGDIDVAKAANTACQVDLAAQGDGLRVAIDQIHLSYAGTENATLSGGRLYIQEGSTTLFDVDITATGLTTIAFRPPLEMDANTDAKVNLTAGGNNMTGKLNVRAHVVI